MDRGKLYAWTPGAEPREVIADGVRMVLDGKGNGVQVQFQDGMMYLRAFGPDAPKLVVHPQATNALYVDTR